MMEEEITEVTMIQREGKKGPSFWTNLVVLFLLVGIILWAQQWATRLSGEVLPEEESDKQIVLEDLETQKPLVEAEEITVPSVTTPPVKEEKRTESREQKQKAETENGERRTENRKLRVENRKSKVAKKVAPPIYAHDPYTDGSATDLDRPENRQRYFQESKSKREATATPVIPSERDRFIPFESE